MHLFNLAKFSVNDVDARRMVYIHGMESTIICSVILATPTQCRDYGYVDLYDLHEGDRIGLRLSQDGVLEFFVNGESQDIAARDVYTRNSDVYRC